MRFFLFYMFCFSVIGCVNNKVSATYRNLNSNDKFDKINFKTIKKDPTKYQSQNIELIGFYKHSFEESALYPSEFNNDSKRAIWINFHKELPLTNSLTGINLFDSYKEVEKISNRRIRIRGKFNMNLKGHLDSYFGELDNVVSIEVFD